MKFLGKYESRHATPHCKPNYYFQKAFCRRNIRTSVNEMVTLLMVQYSCIARSPHDVCSSFVIPYRSCDILSRNIFYRTEIHNCLWNAIREPRLSAPAVLSIEHEENDRTDINGAINKFFVTKKRRSGARNCTSGRVSADNLYDHLFSQVSGIHFYLDRRLR
jgi:hypothetical protein